MGLNKGKLQQDIKDLLEQMVSYDGQEGHTQNEAIQKFAGGLSAAVDAFVRTGEVNTTVTGSCPQGPVTGNGKGGIS